MRTKKVVVLIPPPVDPGEAPMNINIVSTNRPALLSSPSGIVEKPAVRADVLWKNAASQPMPSVSCSSTVPAASSTAVVVSTTLVCSVNLRKRNRHLMTSSTTRKPIPPKMIRPQVTRLSQTLSW